MRRRSFLCATVLLGCSDDGGATTVDEAKVLSDLAINVLQPTYGALGATVTALRGSLDSLSDATDVATVESAGDAWRAAQTAWERARAIGFGPAKDFEANIRWNLGCDPADVEATISAGPPYDPATLGTTRKGLPAIEYLLFDPEGGAQAVSESLTGDGDRVAFLVALGADLAEQVSGLVEAFEAHADEFAAAGVGSAAYKSPKDAIDALFNQVLYASDLLIQVVAKPLGVSTGALAPELELSRFSDHSLEDAKALLDGVQAVYEGQGPESDGLGLTDLLRARSEALDDQLRRAIADAYAAYEAIPPPLRSALSGDDAVLLPAVDAARALKRLLSADVATALGVTISFSDMDGD